MNGKKAKAIRKLATVAAHHAAVKDGLDHPPKQGYVSVPDTQRRTLTPTNILNGKGEVIGKDFVPVLSLGTLKLNKCERSIYKRLKRGLARA